MIGAVSDDLMRAALALRVSSRGCRLGHQAWAPRVRRHDGLAWTPECSACPPCTLPTTGTVHSMHLRDLKPGDLFAISRLRITTRDLEEPPPPPHRNPVVRALQCARLHRLAALAGCHMPVGGQLALSLWPSACLPGPLAATAAAWYEQHALLPALQVVALVGTSGGGHVYRGPLRCAVLRCAALFSMCAGSSVTAPALNAPAILPARARLWLWRTVFETCWAQVAPQLSSSARLPPSIPLPCRPG